MSTVSNILSVKKNETSCRHCATRRYCIGASLGDCHLEQLQKAISQHRRLIKGERLFNQGDDFSSLFLLQSGSVKAYIINDDGEHQITNFHFSGELLGIDGIDSGFQNYCIEALETCSICEFDFEGFLQLTNTDANLRLRFLKMLGREFARERQHLLVLGKMQADQKIANFILDVAAQKKLRGQSNINIHISMSRRDIANYLGLAVETVSRVLHRFNEVGMIRVKNRTLEIINLDRYIPQPKISSVRCIA